MNRVLCSGIKSYYQFLAITLVLLRKLSGKPHELPLSVTSLDTLNVR